MTVIAHGDILEKTQGIICHQVNSCGVMGAGLAKTIKDTYPIVYKEYIEEYNTGLLNVGSVSFTEVGNDLYIANLCAQNKYGFGRRFTDYNAFSDCLLSVKEFAKGLSIFFPYGIGCGLAGGDWNIINDMIETIIPDAIIVKLRVWQNEG